VKIKKMRFVAAFVISKRYPFPSGAKGAVSNALAVTIDESGLVPSATPVWQQC